MQLDKSMARRHFSRAARSYDKWSRPQESMAERLMRMITDEPRPRSILEIGCGTGILTGEMMTAYPSARIMAVDIAEGMVEACTAKFAGAQGAEFVVADAEAMCVDETFDLIASNSCFQWMSDLPGTLRKLAELMAPEGMLAFSSPVEGTLHELWSSYAVATDGAMAGHTLPSAASYEQALLRAGFTDTFVDQQTLVFAYPTAQQALQSIRELGATRATRDDTRLTRNQLNAMIDFYQENFRSADGGVTCTYNVFYVRARR